jgi:ankyrin repeat protein
MDTNQQKKIDEQFLISVNIGDIEQAITAIESGANIHAVTEIGDNALTLAAMKQKEEMFDWLLDIKQNNKKIDINHRNLQGGNIVYELVREGDRLKYLEKALKAGADPDQEVYAGMTPLMRACTERKLDEAKILLENNANVNKEIVNSKVTPFLLAISSADFELSSLLIEHDKNVINQIDSYGNNVLVNLLMKGTQYMKKKQKEERMKLCEFLIDNGIDINHKNSTGLCAFWAASLMNETEVVAKLLEKNVDVDAWNMEMQNGLISAFHYWNMRGNLEMVEELYKRGAQFNKTDGLGNTPESYGFLQAPMRELLVSLKEVNLDSFFHQVDPRGNIVRSPLISLAIADGDTQTEIVSKMIDNGVTVTFNDVELEKFEPILMAIASASTEVAKKILDTGKVQLNRTLKLSDASEERMSPLACLVSDMTSKKMQAGINLAKQLEAIVKSGGKSNINGQQVQIYNDEQLKAIEEQLKKTQGMEEDVELKRREMFDILIKNGANVNFQDSNGVTALFYAKKPFYVELLKNAGANFLHKDNDGDTALIASIKMNNKEMINCFKEEYSKIDKQEVDKVFYDLAFSRIENHSGMDSIQKGILEFIGEENKKTFLESRVNFIYSQKMKSFKEALKAEQEAATEKKTQEEIKELLAQYAEKAHEEAIEQNKQTSIRIDNINYQDEDGNSPLLIACANNLSFLVDLYADFGAKIDLSNKNGETPLMHAIASDNHRLVEFLLANGANPETKTNENKSVLDFAKENDNKIILEMIYQATGLNIVEGGLSGTRKVKP